MGNNVKVLWSPSDGWRHFWSVSINDWWISLTKLEYVFFIIGVKNNQQCGSKGGSVSICASR